MEKNETIVVIAIVAVLIFLFSGFGMMGFGGYGGYGMMGGMMQWGLGTGFGFAWIFGLILWILVITALVLFIMWLAKQLESPRGRK